MKGVYGVWSVCYLGGWEASQQEQTGGFAAAKINSPRFTNLG